MAMKLFHYDSFLVVALLVVTTMTIAFSLSLCVTSVNKVLSKVDRSVLISLFETCVVKFYSLKIFIEI